MHITYLRKLYQWVRARLQYFQCISSGDTAVLHLAIDICIFTDSNWDGACSWNLSSWKKKACFIMQSISCLLMLWWQKEPEHQQPKCLAIFFYLGCTVNPWRMKKDGIFLKSYQTWSDDYISCTLDSFYLPCHTQNRREWFPSPKYQGAARTVRGLNKTSTFSTAFSKWKCLTLK